MDFCKFFADIERDPKAIIPKLTVREFIKAKEHGQTCDVCSLRIERTLAKAPKEYHPNISLN